MLPLALPLLTTAPERPELFALVVSNNQTVALGRRALQYADDDGSKYREVFAAFTSSDSIELLTQLDADSERLFPEAKAVARPPTRAAVEAAALRLAAAVAQATAAGRRTELFFVFAGHGDVDKGKGFLELADGPFDSDQLAALLRTVKAHRSHVILDSCNSFFVVSPRKPGGRRFATPADVAESLAKRLPATGVLLSTNAEAEVYEWSELQSGVFSHAVRSGMLGAADANADQKVTYAELSAFVAVASAGIENPLFRPKVFARGPGGDEQAVLVDLSGAPGTRLVIDERGPVRLTLRDRLGLRWVDAHKEQDTTLAIHLPARLLSGLQVERWNPEGTQVQGRFELPEPAPGGEVPLGTLVASGNSLERRGADDGLKKLFARPFGPKALASYQAEAAAAPEPVFGLSREDQARMQLLLRAMVSSEAQQRTMAVTTAALGLGTSLAVLGMKLGQRTGAVEWWPFWLGGSLGGIGVVGVLGELEGQAIMSEFERGLGRPGADPSAVVAYTDFQLRRYALREGQQKQRLRTAGIFGVGGAVLGIGASFLFADRLSPQDQDSVRWSGLMFGITGTAAIVRASMRSPTEQLITLWNEDPGIERVRLSVAPSRQGATLLLAGSF